MSKGKVAGVGVEGIFTSLHTEQTPEIVTWAQIKS